VAGHADLAAAAGTEDRLIQPGPGLDLVGACWLRQRGFS